MCVCACVRVCGGRESELIHSYRFNEIPTLSLPFFFVSKFAIEDKKEGELEKGPEAAVSVATFPSTPPSYKGALKFPCVEVERTPPSGVQC